MKEKVRSIHAHTVNLLILLQGLRIISDPNVGDFLQVIYQFNSKQSIKVVDKKSKAEAGATDEVSRIPTQPVVAQIVF